MQTVPARLHFSNAALKSGGEGLVGEGGPNDGHEDFMQVGEAINRVSESLIIDLGINCADSVAD
jgi:hypothetical protein